MHAPSPMALLVIAIVVLVLFGRGKVSSLMGEFGKGITAFKKGINDGNAETNAERNAALDKPVQPTTPVQPVPGAEARDVTPQNEPRV
ncbi:twin arginine translocase protein A [Paracoccus haematequi]|uniref:Sec-independent protein translocase protein TatA n=1 Tax=Paracoccus haematequi TaxID=2491866 RepID=A0A447IQT7_9RHOB|nr:twin-arginine translocase TatA/TatE family subunit [Paracoccus haematequi]VDS09876.1 twin arginine translocase protein A [Paracoccus haematequi]